MGAVNDIVVFVASLSYLYNLVIGVTAALVSDGGTGQLRLCMIVVAIFGCVSSFFVVFLMLERRIDRKIPNVYTFMFNVASFMMCIGIAQAVMNNYSFTADDSLVFVEFVNMQRNILAWVSLAISITYLCGFAYIDYRRARVQNNDERLSLNDVPLMI